MRKLSLSLDQLNVDSFETSAKAAEKGTVFGEQCTCDTNCTCPGCPTCDHTLCQQDTCEGCDGSVMYTDCGGNTFDDPTCDPTNSFECCPM